MKITYDKEVDALYVYFKKGKVSKTVKIGKDFLADVDRDGNMLGLEVLNASRHISDTRKKIEILVGNKTIQLPALV